MLLAVTTYSQNWNWSRMMGSPNVLASNAVCTDASGFSYVVGAFSGTADFGSGISLTATGQEDMFLVKYDNFGSPVWAIRGGMGQQDNARDIKIDPAGDIYIVGEYTDSIRFATNLGSVAITSAGGVDLYVAKFDPADGKCVWLKSAGGTGADAAYALALMGTDIYVTGSFEGIATFGSSNTGLAAGTDAFLAQLNAQTQTWTWVRRGGASGSDRGTSLCTDGSSVYMTGHFQGMNFSMGAGMAIGNGGIEGFVAKVSTAGLTQWIATIENPTGTETPTKLASDGTDIYVTGHTTSSGNLTFRGSMTLSAPIPGVATDMWLGKITSNGTWLWVRVMGGPNSELSMTVLPIGTTTVAIAGSYENALQLGNNALSGNGVDCFLATFSALDGLTLGAMGWGGAGNSIANGLSLDPNCNLITSGDFNGSISYSGASNLSASGSKSGHLASIGAFNFFSPALSPAADSICPGDSITLNLTGVPFTSISWEASTDNGATWIPFGSPNSDSIRVAPQGTTIYRSNYSDNCTSGSLNATILVQTGTIPSIVALPDTSCSADSPFNFTVSPAIPLGNLSLPSGFADLGGGTISMDPGAATAGWSTVQYTYTDSTGCPNSVSDSVFVANPAILSINGFQPQFCSSDTVNHLFSGNLAPVGTISSNCNCLTNVGSGTATFQPSAAPVGTPISLMYAYSNGCNTQVSYNIVVNANPIVDIIGLPSAACTGDSAFLISTTDTMGTFSPAIPGITDLGNGTAIIDPTLLSLGNHTITYTVNSGSCPGIDTASIFLHPLPMVSISGFMTAYCQDADIDTVLGTPPTNYIFQPSAPYLVDIGNGQALFIPGLAPLDSLIPLSYTHTSAVGCSATSTDLVIVRAVPVPEIQGLDTAYCAGALPDTLRGNFPNNGSWSTASFLDSLSPASAILSPDSCVLDAQLWVVYAATNAYGCTAADSASFRVSSLPSPSAGADAAICEGDSALLGLSPVPGQSYQWTLPNGNPGGTTAQTLVTPASTSTYVLETANAYGCTTMDSVVVTVAPSPIVYAGVDDTICLGDSLTLPGAAAGHTSLLWYDGFGWTSTLAQPQFAPTQSATYTLVAQGAFATCRDSDQVIVTVVQPITNLDAGPDLNVGSGEDVQLQAVAPSSGTGTWYCASGILQPENPNAYNSAVLAPPPGTWTMIWEVTNSPCPVQRDSILITVTELHFPTGFSPNGDGVNDMLVFAGLEMYAENQLKVFNRWGNLVAEFNNYGNNWSGTNASGQPLPEDTYYYVLDLGDGQAVTRYLVLKRLPE